MIDRISPVSCNQAKLLANPMMVHAEWTLRDKKKSSNKCAFERRLDKSFSDHFCFSIFILISFTHRSDQMRQKENRKVGEMYLKHFFVPFRTHGRRPETKSMKFEEFIRRHLK